MFENCYSFFNYNRLVFNTTGLTQFCQILGKFGLTLNSDLSSGSSSGNIDTFHTIQLTPSTDFDIDHVEVRKLKYFSQLFLTQFLYNCLGPGPDVSMVSVHRI